MNKAKEYLNDAYILNRKDVLTLINIASIYFSENKYDKAIETYEKAIKVNPNSSTLWFKYGRLFFMLKEYDKAEECFKKSLEIRQIQPFSYEYLANIEKIRGNEEAYLVYKDKEKNARKNYNAKLKDRYLK